MAVRPFTEIYNTVVARKGSEAYVKNNLPAVKSPAELEALGDDRYLSEMCRRIFRAGLKHSMVDAKWPAFEKSFFHFKPLAVAMLDDEAIDERMHDTALIRHLGKIKAVRLNAAFVLEVARQHGSFGHWLAQWPEDDIVGLWLQIKQQGAQLGGQSAPRFLRMVGKDTFLMSRDVVAFLIGQGVISKEPTAKKDLYAVQAVFNQWRRESGLPLAHISRVVSMLAD